MKNKRRRDVYLDYYPTGELRGKIEHIGGIRNGKALFFNRAGVLISAERYKNDKPQGRCVFYDESGKYKGEATFSKGLLNGLAIYYYKNGLIKAKKRFRKDKLDGKAERYSSTGRLVSTNQYWDANLASSKKVRKSRRKSIQ